MKALVFSDEPKNAREILTYLRGKMEMDVISTEDKELPEYGAQKVYFYKDGFVDNLSKFLADHISKNRYDFVFISSTNIGRELAGILSYKLKMKCMPEIFSFSDSTVTFAILSLISIPIAFVITFKPNSDERIPARRPEYESDD